MDTSDIAALVHNSTASEEEVLIRNLLLSHDPDGRDVDSELLLKAVKNVFQITTSLETKFDTAERSNCRQIDEAEPQAFTGHVVDNICCEMFYQHYQTGDLHTKTMNLLDLLGAFQWNDKMVLILAGLAFIHSKFWLVNSLQHQNALAGLISVLRQSPNSTELFKPHLKALNLLIGKMVELTEHVAKFNSIPVTGVNMDPALTEITKHHMYLAAYWVARCGLRGSSHIADLSTMKLKRVCRNSAAAAAAAWDLLSLVSRLSNLCIQLQRLVEVCRQQTDEKLYEKLLSLQKSTHVNNQQVLYALFSLKDDLPFKKSLSQEKVGISEFQDKVVILLILKPNLLTKEELLLLYHQMYGYPCKNNLKGSYQIIYVPIPDSSSWSDTEEQNYKFLSNQFPWYSISRPRFLSPAVLNFIKHEWNYRDEPIAVVIDTRGSVTNLKAIHMMKIWGFDAYPFSSSREEELWRTEKSTFQLLLTRIEPLLADRIQEGQNICIYGGDDVRWIREFHRRIEETILGTGLQLILVYVGKRALTSKVRNILLSRTWESLGPNNISLSITSIQFFWICLDSIRRSIPPQMNKSNAGHILQDALGLLELDGSEPGWAMLHDGLSRDALRLQSKELMKCFELFPIWRINMQKWGLVGAMRMALEVPSTAGPCSHSETTLFEEFLLGKIVFCSECRRPLKSYIIYE